MEKKASEKIAFFTALAMLAIILGAHFFLSEAALRRKIYTPAYILAFLNIVFLGLTSVSIAYLAGRAYLRSGSLGIFLLSTGALVFGAASILSEWFMYAGGGVNIADTISTESAFVTGCLYFAATVSVLVGWPRERDPLRREKKLKIGAASALLIEAVIIWAAYQELFPTFFTEGVGPSPMRQITAGISSSLLFLAGLHILIFYVVNRTEFLFWYALSLIMLAEGLLAAILQRSDFGLIGWTGRMAQYLGGLYLLVAAFDLVRQRPLEHVLTELLNNPVTLYASLFENSMEGIVLAVERGPLLAANPQALAMLGFDPEDVRRLELKDLLDVQDPGVRTFLGKHARGCRFRGELPMIRKDGSTFPAEITSSVFEDHQGTLLKALLFRDVTQLKQSRQALRQAYAENERNLAQMRAVFNQMTDGLVTFTPEGRLSEINQAALVVYGFREDDPMKVHLNALSEFLMVSDLDNNELPPEQWPVGRALRGESFNSVEVHECRRDIDKRWIASYAGTPVYDGNGEMLLALVCVRDITRHKLMEAALRESEARLKGFFKAASVYMAVVELAGDDFVYLLPNQKTAQFFNMPADRLAGMTGRELGLTEEILSQAVGILRQCEKSAEPVTMEYVLPYEGAAYCFLVTISHIPVKQPIARHPRFAVTAFDITPRKEAEEQIKQSLKEKETLLQEIHHRVKNNMQVIISLLNLQAATIQDEKVKTLLKESSSRVNAMALIHNYLYQSSSLSEIDLAEYFESLAGSLVSMYRTSAVNIQVHADNIKLNMDQAIPCGLIINELISNALKHAFPENKTGQIRIEAIRTQACYILQISDNGVGLPEEVVDGKMESLGLKLVRGLAENQLGGRMSVSGEQGTRFIIEIPTEA